MTKVTALWRYPVKSMRGNRLDVAEVEPWGLAGDRRWMVVGVDGEAVTAREVNAMLLVRPEPTPSGVRLAADGAEPLEVDVPDPAGQVPVTIFGSPLSGAAASPAADAWLSEVLGRTVRLVHLDDPTRRPSDPAFSRAEDRVSFADAYPLLLATEESLAALNDDIGAPLPMTRFRPNVVVSGAPAWAEDDWRAVRIGGPDGPTFRVVTGCDRCVITTVDPRDRRTRRGADRHPGPDPPLRREDLVRGEPGARPAARRRRALAAAPRGRRGGGTGRRPERRRPAAVEPRRRSDDPAPRLPP